MWHIVISMIIIVTVIPVVSIVKSRTNNIINMQLSLFVTCNIVDVITMVISIVTIFIIT